MGQTAPSLLGLVMDNEKQGISPEEGCQDCELIGAWDLRRADGTGSISPGKQKLWEEPRLVESLSQKDFRDHLIVI